MGGKSLRNARGGKADVSATRFLSANLQKYIQKGAEKQH